MLLINQIYRKAQGEGEYCKFHIFSFKEAEFLILFNIVGVISVLFIMKDRDVANQDMLITVLISSIYCLLYTAIFENTLFWSSRFI